MSEVTKHLDRTVGRLREDCERLWMVNIISFLSVGDETAQLTGLTAFFTEEEAKTQRQQVSHTRTTERVVKMARLHTSQDHSTAFPRRMELPSVLSVEQRGASYPQLKSRGMKVTAAPLKPLERGEERKGEGEDKVNGFCH